MLKGGNSLTYLMEVCNTILACSVANSLSLN